MKKTVLYSMSTLLLFSCNNTTETVNNSNQHADNIEDTLMDAQSAEFNFAENTPSGWILGEYFASDDNTYTFCPDGYLYFDNSIGTVLEGDWQLKNDTIYLNYTRQTRQVGIGEPLPWPEAVPGNYVEQYEEYETLIEKVHIQEILIWSEIKEYLNQDSSYPYAIIKQQESCTN